MVGNKFQVLRWRQKGKRKGTKQARNTQKKTLIFTLQLLILIPLFYMATVHILQYLPQIQHLIKTGEE